MFTQSILILLGVWLVTSFLAGIYPAVYLSIYIRGSLVLDPDGDRMEAIVLDDAGLVRDRFMIVKNTAVAPVAGFSATPVRGAAPLTVRFQDLSSTNTASWAWDLDGDAQDDSIEREPEFVYDLPGLYDVTLAVANDSGSDLVEGTVVEMSDRFAVETLAEGGTRGLLGGDKLTSQLCEGDGLGNGKRSHMRRIFVIDDIDIRVC